MNLYRRMTTNCDDPMNQDKSSTLRQRSAPLSLSPLSVPALLCAALMAGCSGSDGGSSGSTSMDLLAINVEDGATWQINRAIEFEFSSPIDFDTVNPNTIEISQVNGQGTVGEFYMDQSNPNKIYWQPVCPTEADYSDAGLLPSTQYRIFVRGANTSPLTLTATTGEQLGEGRTINFETKNAGDLAELFFDGVPGPPVPLVRPPGPNGVGPCVGEGGAPPSMALL